MEQKPTPVIHKDAKKIERAQDQGPDLNGMRNQVECPIKLSRWTQTTGVNFAIARENDYDLPNIELHGEKLSNVLLHKINFFQEILRQHIELLTQIHMKSETKKQKLEASNNSETHNAITSSIGRTQIMTPPNAVVNACQKKSESRTTDSINYKIAAVSANYNGGEPIEIKLSESNGTQEQLNLNNFLQTCLGDEANGITSTHERTPLTQPRINKRRLTMEPLTSKDNFNKSIHISADSNETSTNYGNLDSVLSQQREYLMNCKSFYDISTAFASQNIIHKMSVSDIEKIRQKLLDLSYNTYNLPQVAPTDLSATTKPTVLKTMGCPKQKQTQSSNKINKNLEQKIIIDGMGNEQIAERTTVILGPNKTRVSAHMHNAIKWRSASAATRKLLIEVFGRQVLATHSMSGKPSPAFKDKPAKNRLDPLKVQDIIFAVTNKTGASEKEVRNAITTKCADENKMMKHQEEKQTNGTLKTQLQCKVNGPQGNKENMGQE